MQSIVLVNALKKIGQVYSRISEQDLIKKLGIEQNLDLIQFMNQFNSLIGDFQIDHQNRVVNFNKKVLHDYDEKIKETYMKRMRHLNSLQEHIQKMMKYSVISSMKDKA